MSSSVMLPPIGVGKLTMSLEARNRVNMNEGCALHKWNREGGSFRDLIKVWGGADRIPVATTPCEPTTGRLRLQRDDGGILEEMPGGP